MRLIFGFLASAVSIYSLLILIRIILSWFGSSAYGKPVQLLNSITDPYLNWWRNNLKLRVGALDFSAVAGIAALSVMQNIFIRFSSLERVSLGTILAIIVLTVWSVISFILIFFIVVIIIRLFGYLTNSNMYSRFWQIVDSISQPVLYRLNRIMFGKRISGFLKGIVLSLLLLIAILIAGNNVIPILAGYISRIPI